MSLETEQSADLSRVWYDAARGIAETVEGQYSEFVAIVSVPFDQVSIAEIPIDGQAPTLRGRVGEVGGLVRGDLCRVRGITYRIAEVQEIDRAEVIMRLTRTAAVFVPPVLP